MTTFSLRQSGTNGMKRELKFIYESRPIIHEKIFYCILVYKYTKMYLLLIIVNYKNICKKTIILTLWFLININFLLKKKKL